MTTSEHSIHHDTRRRLQTAGVSDTPNRVLVAGALTSAKSPMSLAELESCLPTLDKSSIFRTLNTLLAHDVIHAIEDGRGISKYELCRTESADEDTDRHCHFYCSRCRRTLCLPDIAVPPVDVPEGFSISGINYMIKGICADCNKHEEL